MATTACSSSSTPSPARLGPDGPFRVTNGSAPTAAPIEEPVGGGGWYDAPPPAARPFVAAASSVCSRCSASSDAVESDPLSNPLTPLVVSAFIPPPLG